MDKFKTLSKILSQIDEINLIGIAYDGKIIDIGNKYNSQAYIPIKKYKVPHSFICQSPDQTRQYKVGMCDSIAALIADDCKRAGIPTVAFVTICNGIPVGKSSHCVVFCNINSKWIRGDMSIEFAKEEGWYSGMYDTLEEALYNYSLWCKSVLHANNGIKLYKYNASDTKYYGMLFDPMMNNIIKKENLYWESKNFSMYDPPTSINIRPATIDDLNILSKYMNDLDSYQVSLNPKLSKSYLTPKYQAQRTRWIKSALLGKLPGVVFYIISNKGFALLTIKQKVSDIYLNNLLVSKEYRGMGIGSAFIAWLKNFRDQYYPDFSISLSCLNQNLAAQTFYESHGFVPVKKDSQETTYCNEPKINNEEYYYRLKEEMKDSMNFSFQEKKNKREFASYKNQKW